MKKIDLTGKKFGRLTVLAESGRNKNNHIIWLCKCDCGNEKNVLGDSLRRGHTLSCGCLALEKLSKRSYKHGYSNERLYRIWAGIKTRTTNKNRREYPNYGGRGIRMCSEWFSDYLVFRKWALENGYGDSLSIDRIDVNGNYEPSNCRWANDNVQMNNQRSNHLITCNGKTQNIAQWSKETGIPRPTISSRIFKYKMTPEKALQP